MKTKKLLAKKLLVLFLCFGILTPMLSVTKQHAESDYYSAVPYSDLPDIEVEI